MSGYNIGPELTNERPWPCQWEQDPRIDDGHHHNWESVLLRTDYGVRVQVDEVIRCAVCHAPRCGHVHDEPPCLLRRHHRGEHVEWRRNPMREGGDQ